jgi:Flp pilus assembly pilin Flp
MRVAGIAPTAIENLVSLWRQWGNNEDGANLAEYGLILALVTILSIPFVTTIGGTVAGFYADFAAAF